MRSRLGRPKLETPAIQDIGLQSVKNAFLVAKKAGMEVIQMDECVFQCDRFRNRTWSPKGNPHRLRGRFAGKPVVVVCGAISPERGIVHFKYGLKSFNGQDMVDMYREVR